MDAQCGVQDATPKPAPRQGAVGWTLLKIDTATGEDGTLTVELRGDLDVYSAAELGNRLRRVEPGSTDLVIDLSGLHFLDCAGARELVDAGRRAAERGARLTLIEGPPRVQRVFALSGLDRTLSFLGRLTSRTGS